MLTADEADAPREPLPAPAQLAPSHLSGTQAVSPSPRRASHRDRAAPRSNEQCALLSPVIAAMLVARASPRAVRHEASTEGIDGDVEQFAPAGEQRRCSSPQPTTAAAAQRAATRETSLLLAADDSQYALCIDDPETLQRLVTECAEAREAGVPHGTAAANEWGFAWVRRFAQATSNIWMRPRRADSAFERTREAYFLAMALVWITQMIKPSARRRRAGFEQGMPTSALLAIYAFCRVMRTCCRFVPELSDVRTVLKGLCMRYKLRWGDDAFVPTRKQPYTNAQLRSIVTVLATGAVPGWTPVLCMAMLVAFCHAISTGTRTDEWTASFKGGVSPSAVPHTSRRIAIALVASTAPSVGWVGQSTFRDVAVAVRQCFSKSGSKRSATVCAARRSISTVTSA
jgi:hypothetical protein